MIYERFLTPLGQGERARASRTFDKRVKVCPKTYEVSEIEDGPTQQRHRPREILFYTSSLSSRASDAQQARTHSADYDLDGRVSVLPVPWGVEVEGTPTLLAAALGDELQPGERLELKALR